MPYSEPPIIHLEPLEHAPEDIVICDPGGAQVGCPPVEHRPVGWSSPRCVPGFPRFTPGTRLVTAFDARHALNLADAVHWAARITQ